MEKQKFPEVRFKGFTDVWKQFRLGELCSEFRSGEFIKAEKIASSGNYPVYGGNGLRGYTDTYNHDGDFALIGRQGALCGNMQFSYGKAFFTEHAVAVKANTSNDTSFLYHLFGTMNLGQYSGQSAQPGLAVGNLIEIETLVPDKTEQTTIGNFFQNLDQSIVLHEKKFTQTQNLKKAMLEKMFPKAGSKQPEIRLKGFSGDWFETTVGNISTSFSGGTPSVLEKSFYGGEIPFIRSGEISDISTELFLTKSGLENSSAKLVEKGTILYALYGATSGEVSISLISGAINQAILAIKPINNNSTLFLASWLRLNKMRILETYLQGGQGNLSGQIVKNIAIQMPCSFEEQLKIGQFFKQLDQTLVLQQQQLQTLKNLKQAFLEKMFV